jgi:hypothetical protein
MGAFGLLEGWHDSITPADAMTSAHPVADVHHLVREGVIRRDQVEIELPVPDTADGGSLGSPRPGQIVRVSWHRSLPLRVWVCGCGHDRYKLWFVHGRWACIDCHLLTWASRHKHRTIPKLARLRWLRQRIGADPTPFTPLPAKPLRARRHWRLCREIRRLEQALIEHGRRDVAAVLERRHARSR